MRVPGWDYRLPAVPRRFHLETIDSYIQRLARANGIDPVALDQVAQRDPDTGLAKGKSDSWKPMNVALWTGIPADHFGLNASIAYSSADPRRPAPTRHACSHCSHGEPVLQYQHYFQHICIKHHRWLPHGYNAQRTVNRATLAAELRYQRLIRRSLNHAPLAFRILSTIQDDVHRRLRRMGYGAGEWERVPLTDTAVWDDRWKVEKENKVREAIAQYPMFVDLLAISVSRPVLDALTCHIALGDPYDHRGNRIRCERRLLDYLYGHPIRTRLGHGDWLVLNELPGIIRGTAEGWTNTARPPSAEPWNALPTPTWPTPRPRRADQWHLSTPTEPANAA